MMLALDLIAARAGAASVAEDVRVVLGAFEAGIFCRSTSGDGDPHWGMQFVKPLAALASLQRAVTHEAARDIGVYIRALRPEDIVASAEGGQRGDDSGL